MKRHALLIFAHDDPAHLSRLIRPVTAPWVSVFVHIDQKSDIREFREALSLPGVVTVEPRMRIHWGGWSQVQATLHMIEFAMGIGHFDYFTLMSGAHFPLHSSETIRDYIESADAELINIVRVPNHELNKPIDRFTKISFDGMHRNRSFSGLFMKGLARVLNSFPRRLAPIFKEWIPYAGSNWWTLSAEAITYVMQTVHDRPELPKAFHCLDCPDEGFFQTLLGNSPFRDRCTRAIVYTDWTNPKEAPCFLRPEHIQSLYAPGFCLSDGYGIGKALYARKLGTRNLSVVEAILALH